MTAAPDRIVQPDQAISASALLGRFNQAGVLALADVHVAQTLGRLGREAGETVLLAVALTVRALRTGSVCLDVHGVEKAVLDDLRDPALDPEVTAAPAAELPWPEPSAWLTRIADSPMVARGMDAPANQLPVRLVDDLLYLERYWLEETVVRTQLDERAARPVPPVDASRLTTALDALFDGVGLGKGEEDRQRRAANAAAHRWTTVVAGGPGTGKTSTVAKLLATLQAQTATPLRIGLAAPSGKAAARLDQAVNEAIAKLPPGIERPGPEQATTLHRLLEARGAGAGFGRGAANPLPHHVVVVDEVSMVALPLMARLLEALRPDTRLVLVGDHHQLTSVDAGSVLADLVAADQLPDAPDRGEVVELLHTWRYGEEIDALARAIREGRADTVLDLLGTGTDVRITEVSSRELAGWKLDASPDLAKAVLHAGRAVHAAAANADRRPGAVTDALAHLDDHRLLCAHREGRFGVARWGRLVEEHLRATIPGYGAEGEWYLGRPLLVTQNLRDLDLANGDSGVVVATPEGARAAFGDANQPKFFSPYLLDQVTSLHAMTVHKAQGSQFEQVTVVLPPPDSPLLTRELLYTAVTRAKSGVHLLGDPESVRRAVLNPSGRSSGLARGW